ncbi:amidase [Microthyrium microscopicum]|uniref:Amidase n=1 Tax=Microthyrium microscopicum TaxID=703497 RepID=A0A6A6UDN0_9PEZI|nr:amidase [Microthyrium microscopicum]
MVEIDELTIDQVHSAYKNGTFTCRQLVEAYLERIELLDKNGPKLNAITAVSVFALDEADALDGKLKASGEFVGPLHGIPVIVKDQCDTIGIETTYGNITCKHVPTTDATLVKKLKDAGAVVLAKSTMPDFAASFSSASSVSGVTLCPYDITRETGGSSAGSGAAIAANYGLIGVGEDTGGSIRVPASFCNLVGLRPTVGLVSRTGLSPLVKFQDTPGPMTRTVKDAALMLDVLVGYDPLDPYTASIALAGQPRGGSYAANLSTEYLPKARIGVLNSVFGDEASSECAAVNKVIRNALEKISGTGTTLIDIVIPKLDHYVAITNIYMSRSRFDINNFLQTRPALKTSVQSIAASNSYHPSLALFRKLSTSFESPFDDPMYAQRIEEHAEFQRLVIGIMTENKLDAIAFPSVKIPAPLVSDVVGTRFEDDFPSNTIVGSQLRFPAISIPVGFTDEGLPVGLELLGVLYQEQTLLELAFGVEALTKGRRAPKF